MIPVAHLDLPPLPPPAHIVTIAGNLGGSIDQFGRRVQVYIDGGTKVRVMGECASACTMVTALPPDRICVGPDASLEFHQAYTLADPSRIAPNDIENRSEAGVAFLMAFYPQKVRDWIASKGGLTAELIVLKGAELRTMFRACTLRTKS